MIHEIAAEWAGEANDVPSETEPGADLLPVLQPLSHGPKGRCWTPGVENRRYAGAKSDLCTLEDDVLELVFVLSQPCLFRVSDKEAVRIYKAGDHIAIR